MGLHFLQAVEVGSVCRQPIWKHGGQVFTARVINRAGGNRRKVDLDLRHRITSGESIVVLILRSGLRSVSFDHTGSHWPGAIGAPSGRGPMATVPHGAVAVKLFCGVACKKVQTIDCSPCF